MQLRNCVKPRPTRSVLGVTAAFLFGVAGLMSAPAAGAVPSGPHPGGPPSASAFDGTYSGTSYSYTDLTEPALHLSPKQLGPDGSATFTTTITSDRYAAQWDDSTAQLVIVGFRPVGDGHVRTLHAYGSMIYAQDNSMGAGYCANDQFIDSSGNFVFGDGAACYAHTPPPYGSTETYSVTIYGNNTFTDTVTIDSGCGNCTTGPYAAGQKATFSGSLALPANTQYYVAAYLLPGRLTADPSATGTFTVAGSSYVRG